MVRRKERKVVEEKAAACAGTCVLYSFVVLFTRVFGKIHVAHFCIMCCTARDGDGTAGAT